MGDARDFQPSELFGRPLPKLPTVHDLLTDSAKSHGSKIAVACLHQKPDYLSSMSGCDASKSNHLRWSFDELLRASHAMAIALAERGIKPGDMILAYVANGIEFHIIMRAALELNCPFAPLNPKTVENAKETKHYLNVLKPAVVMVPDRLISQSIIQSAPTEIERAKVLLVYDGDCVTERWQDICSFVKNTSGGNSAIDSLQAKRNMEDVILILFTSGTTSLPKGVPHSNTSLATIFINTHEVMKLDYSRVCGNHAPLSHGLGIIFFGMFHFAGAKVVHPSGSYDAGAGLAAIREEGVTDIPGVPSMISAMLEHPDFKKTDTSGLKCIVMGATDVLPEHIRRCTKELKAAEAMDEYGLSESGPVWMAPPDQTPDKSYPLLGAMLRVCDPETGDVLSRGEAGELHLGGPQIITRYLLGESQDAEKANSCFYDDQYGHWIKTGDRAVMAENGLTKILGRYKDLVIRGGEKIAPGQELDLPEVREKIIRELGSAFAIEKVIPITDLGMEDYPKTPSGKVQKGRLRDMAAKHLQDEQNEGSIGRSSTYGSIETLSQLWVEFLGIHSTSLTPQTSVRDFADSLMISRFCAKLRRTTGQVMTLQQVLNQPTIEAQAALLSASSSTQKADYSDIPAKHDGPLEMHHIAHVASNSVQFESIERLTREILSPLGLAWDDVEDIIPMHGNLARVLTRQRPQSHNHRHAWLVRDSTVPEVASAIKKALRNHPIMRSMAIRPDHVGPLHVILRPTDKFFSHCIRVVDPVADSNALDYLHYNNSEIDYAADPGPMYKVLVTEVKQENCTGILWMSQHSTYDGISVPMFLEDVDAALVAPNVKLNTRVPYTAWAQSCHNLRDSESAKYSISWNADRLSGISKQQNALFPVARAPGMFKGNADGWIDLSTGRPGPKREMLDDFDGARGFSQRAHIRDARQLNADHGIEVPQIVRAALAILNCRRTGAGIALFGQHQAGRTWPFLSDWQASRMPEAMEVNGPTFETLVMRIPVVDELLVIKMLQSLQDEQVLLNKHVHAPYDMMVREMNKRERNAGDVMEEVLRRQTFNWLPGGALAWKRLQVVSMISRTYVGILWNCSMSARDEVQVHASWDSAQLKKTEMDELLKELVDLIEQLADRESWLKRVVDLK
jgi:acyl-CoA synthetase (AMP-forming)/AMP-acid ligase II